jgi:hypothetical protein
LKGIYGYKFPKRFLEISSRDFTLLSILIIKRPAYQSIGALYLSICKAECLATKQSRFSQFIRPMSLLNYTSNTKTDCVLKKVIEALKSKGSNCNDGSFQVLGAVGTLSFSKFCQCIHKCLLGSWKSS